MAPTLTTLISLISICLLGTVLGWRLGVRRSNRSLLDAEKQIAARSLELLETRQHLRKISAHLKTSLKKDNTILQLRQKQKSLLRQMDQQILAARRCEQAHYIQIAKMELKLTEAQMPLGQNGPAQNRSVSLNGKQPIPTEPSQIQALNSKNEAGRAVNGPLTGSQSAGPDANAPAQDPANELSELKTEVLQK